MKKLCRYKDCGYCYPRKNYKEKIEDSKEKTYLEELQANDFSDAMRDQKKYKNLLLRATKKANKDQLKILEGGKKMNIDNDILDLEKRIDLFINSIQWTIDTHKLSNVKIDREMEIRAKKDFIKWIKNNYIKKSNKELPNA